MPDLKPVPMQAYHGHGHGPWMMVGLLFDVRWRVFWREIGRFGGRLMTWREDMAGDCDDLDDSTPKIWREMHLRDLQHCSRQKSEANQQSTRKNPPKSNSISNQVRYLMMTMVM